MKFKISGKKVSYLISLNEIVINYGSRVLFDRINFRIAGKDRFGLVGVNGAGKSTLLKIIAGLQNPDSGEFVISKHTTVGYLPQETVILSGKSIFDEVYNSVQDLKFIQNEMKEIEKELESGIDKDSEEYFDLVNEYAEFQERFHLLEGYKINSNIEKILTGLGFDKNDFERIVDEFSGGWQMRIALAKLLLTNPSVLLLDEPTNHLDINSLLWIEDYLKNYSGAVLIVSHDKNFLNNLTKKTIEITNGKINKYSGNYSFYETEKEKLKLLQKNQIKNQQKYIQEQEKFIERFRYKATKAKAVQSRIKMLEKIDLVQLEEDEENIRFRFPKALHSGKIVLEIKNLFKSYDGNNFILENINLMLNRGEKIAFLGVNGAGKSTLTRIIAGFEPHDRGEIKDGYMVQKKYFAQNQAEELNSNLTVLEILESTPHNNSEINIRKILGGFLFKGDDVFKKVSVLSGGEKSRLALAKMLIEPSNFLILDEPTNHLDISSKDILKKALQEYEGTVIIVSHDREFLDDIVTKVIEFENKKVKTFMGNSSEYIRMKDKERAGNEKKLTESGIQGASPEKENKWLNEKNKRKEYRKQYSKIKKSVSELESKILNFENRKRELEEIMGNKDFFKDVNKVVELKNEYEDIQNKLINLNKFWETETEKLTKLENLNN